MTKKKAAVELEASSGMSGGQNLAAYLAQVREIRKLTLRDVEEASDKQVSNAYLSQLEKGKISKPSPNILHVLSRVYNVAYDTLMEKAGYVVATSSADVLRTAAKVRKNALANEELSNEEEAKLMEYLAFIRRR